MCLVLFEIFEKKRFLHYLTMIKFLLVDAQKLVRPRKYCKKINEDKEICKNVKKSQMLQRWKVTSRYK